MTELLVRNGTIVPVDRDRRIVKIGALLNIESTPTVGGIELNA